MTNNEYRTYKVSAKVEIGREELINALDDYVHNAPVGELVYVDVETLKMFAKVIEIRLEDKIIYGECNHEKSYNSC